MYSNPKIPAPFCGRPCKKMISAPSVLPEKPIRQESAPVQTKSVPIKAAEEKHPPQKNASYNPVPLLVFLILSPFFEKREG